MYATIRSYSGGGDFADALVEREGDIRSVIGSIDGFQGYYVLRTADGVTTISVFDDQAGAEASTSAAAAYVAENMADVSPGPPQVTTGEVVLSF
jgi:heme-degrading monooxygenase HmoA